MANDETAGEVLVAAGIRGDVVDIMELATKRGAVEVIKVEHDGHKATILSIPKGGQGVREVIGAQGLIDAQRVWPKRRAGTAVVHDLDSFIAHVNRFKDPHSVVFAARRPKPGLVAVLDYHHPSPMGVSALPPPDLLSLPGAAPPPSLFNGPGAIDGLSPEGARWGQHRTAYAFPLSPEWEFWTSHNGDKQAVAQAGFAAMLEDRILDIRDPSELGAEALKIAEVLGADYASAGQLLELSRGMTLREGSTVRNVVNLGSGEVQLVYETHHTDERGAPLKVPSLFAVLIPIFEGGALYEIPVRLRYRRAGGAMSWYYELHRPELMLDHAVVKAATEAAARTGLPLLFGAPEAV